VDLPWSNRKGRVFQALVSRDGALWVATRWGVFRRRDPASQFEHLSSDYVWGLSQSASGDIWTTDIAAGFRRLGDGQAPDIEDEGAGHRLMHDRRGNLWVATFGEGLWRVREHDEADRIFVERAGRRTGLSSDSVQSLKEDRDGNIWVGTTGGLHRLTERILTPLENDGFVVVVEAGEDERLWAGTTNGVTSFSPRRGQWERSAGAGLGPDVRSLYRDPEGVLWVGATDGLWRLSGDELVHLAAPSLPEVQVLSISPDGRGGLWLTDTDWLYRWDGTHLTPFDVPADWTGARRITFARGDRSHRLWMGFSDGRLAYVTRDGVLRPLGPAEGLEVDGAIALHDVFEDEAGVVWMGTSRGLMQLADGRLTLLTREHGLPENRVWAVIDDRLGRLWLNIDGGIARIDRRDVATALATPGYQLRYRLYDTSDGVAGAPVGIMGSARASDGTLWFVRGGGVTLLDPRTIEHDDTVPRPAPVRIESVAANERRLSPVPDASLPPGTKRLQIVYAALSLTASNSFRFRYRLDGFDSTWVDAGARRSAFYTNLSPGSYTFRVEASTADGRWSTATAAWNFAIRPTFYQSNWFYALSIAGVMLAVWGTWRFRLRRVRREFLLVLAERTRLSREIHDTLLQSLVGVALQVEAISHSMAPGSSSTRDQLLRVRRLVEGYIREARDSIWDLRSPVFKTRDLATALRDVGRNAVEDQSVRFVSTVTGTPRPCAPQIENQLLRIGREAVTNAVRHAEATSIEVELRFGDGVITLRVSDDGRGFDYDCLKRSMDNHYGLTTMKERTEQLGGRFTVATAIEQGTSIEAVVPMVPRHAEPTMVES
jgi:signal transduction histidine kinase/ligand-binding sensor domain-containing protein